ncbi:MAG: GGDEF domain-containing protein [Clostridia bacterium]|nr:GGDEF domain-containing protein [Clostridia bacterium]
MNKPSPYNVPGGVRLRSLGVGMMIIAIVFVVLNIFSIVRVRFTHREIADSNDSFIELQKNADEFELASEYLTENARAFVSTGERSYIDQYFNERNNVKRRDNALARIRAVGYENTIAHLEEAAALSAQLEKDDLYAMVLILEADNADLTTYPRILQDVVLAEEDQGISGMRKTAKAQALVYATEYNEIRKKIHNEVEACKESLLEEVLMLQQHREFVLDRLLWGQSALIGLIFILIFSIFFIQQFLVIKPLNELHSHIQNQDRLPLHGSYELQFISATYNDVFIENQQIRAKLDYEASHDALTGLLNRRRFDDVREMHRERTMVLIDVDNFKHFNDTFGHDVGDAVLQKVARVLTDYFCRDSGIYRIGGDEFAVIMTDVVPNQQKMLEDRFRKIQHALRQTDDVLPDVSVSIGVALSDRRNGSDNALKDADMALYEVKERGRNGFAFYHAA